MSEFDLDNGVGVSVGVIVKADDDELEGENESVLIEVVVVVFAIRSHWSLFDQTDSSGLNEPSRWSGLKLVRFEPLTVGELYEDDEAELLLELLKPVGFGSGVPGLRHDLVREFFIL